MRWKLLKIIFSKIEKIDIDSRLAHLRLTWTNYSFLFMNDWICDLTRSRSLSLSFSPWCKNDFFWLLANSIWRKWQNNNKKCVDNSRIIQNKTSVIMISLWAVVVAQLVEVRGSNPVSSQFLCRTFVYSQLY